MKDTKIETTCYAIAKVGTHYDTDYNATQFVVCLYAVSLTADEVIDRFMRHPDTTDDEKEEFGKYLNQDISSIFMLRISEAVYYRALELGTIPVNINDLPIIQQEDGTFILESELT